MKMLLLDAMRTFISGLCAICVSLAIIATLSEAGQDKPNAGDLPDLTGYYVCKGHDAAGTYYSGIATVQKIGEVYVISWSVGLSSNHGIGIRQGGWLSVGWTMTKKEELIKAVTVYKIDDGKRTLTGRWATLPGNGKTHEETLTFLKAIELPPDPDNAVICHWKPEANTFVTLPE